MPKENQDLRDCYTAFDCRDRLPDLAAALGEDELKQITIWREPRFEAGKMYLDLDNLARGPFVADGAEGFPYDHTYASRDDMPIGVWARLASWGQVMAGTHSNDAEVKEVGR